MGEQDDVLELQILLLTAIIAGTGLASIAEKAGNWWGSILSNIGWAVLGLGLIFYAISGVFVFAPFLKKLLRKK